MLGVAEAVLINISDALYSVGDNSDNGGDGYGRTMGLALAEAAVGAACGALIGSGAGSLTGAWYRKFRRSHAKW
jgi:hypothetical protein